MAKLPAKESKLNAAVQALDSKKAEEITILDMEGKSSVARYFVIASGNSSTHLNALRRTVVELWKTQFGQTLNIDGQKESHWQVLDADDILIHLFTPAERTHYNLEALWGDAKQLKLKLGPKAAKVA